MFWIALILYILGILMFSVLLLIASTLNPTTRETFNRDECYQALIFSIFWPFLMIGLFIIYLTKGK